MNQDIKQLQFKYFSIQTVFCLLMIVCNLIEYGLLFYTVPVVGIQTAGYVIFYSVAISAALKFIHLARGWKDFICLISRYEKPFLRYPYMVVNGKSLTWKIRVFGLSILALAGIEHGLLLISNVILIQLKLDRCNMTIPDVGKHYIENTRSQWLLIWDYHPLQILIFEYANYAITFCWNFVDVLIMIVSISVSYRFDQIYQRVRCETGKGMATFMYPQNFWRDIRINYMNVLKMLQKINEDMSLLTAMSLGNSIYFICLQLYNST